jgi:DNA-dependent protein kinase catalytic subunit
MATQGPSIKLRKRFESVQASSKSGTRQKFTSKHRETFTNKAKTARSNQVVMFRKYRSGELPDVQIKPKDIIVPLQALAAKDSILSRQIFTHFFKGIIDSASDVRMLLVLELILFL